MFYDVIKSGLTTAFRIITLHDYWKNVGIVEKLKLILVFALNITDTLAKLAGPLALAKSIETVANSQESVAIFNTTLTPAELLYYSALFNAIHFLIPDFKKIILYGLPEKYAQQLSDQIVKKSITLSMRTSHISLTELLQESSKHLQCVNSEADNLLNSVVDNIHPLILDTIFGISFTFSRFENEVGTILVFYLLIAVIINESLCHLTGLSTRAQQIGLAFSKYVRNTHEALINSETVHLFNRKKLGSRYISNQYQAYLNFKKTNYRYERLWMIQSALAGLVQLLAAAYVVKDDFQKLDLDDIIFLLNYVANLGDVVQTINQSLRTAITAIESIDEANEFINPIIKELSKSPWKILNENHHDKTPFVLFCPPSGNRFTISNKIFPDSHLAIEFNNVSFYYNPHEPILTSISFKIMAGEKFAFVGNTNIGKTTIIKLLCRMIKPTDPNSVIKIFGTNIEDIPIKLIRRFISIARQQIELFEDESLMYNTLYGFGTDDELYDLKNSTTQHYPDTDTALLSPSATEKVYQSIQKTLLTGVLQRDTCRGFSGGQRQRIGIARVLARNSSIFVFDEPTSQLDSQTEQSILANIQQATRGKTLLMIAHRLSTIKDAKKIFVLGKTNQDSGAQVIEEGTHDELIMNNQHYANLWRLQTR